MTADDAREALEAIVWRTRCVDQHAIIGILAAADRYAEAVADERIAGRVADRIRGPERRAAAAADVAAHYRRTG